MSVQTVSSAPAAAESGVARKRATGPDSGRASETFALPEDTETAASNTAPKSTTVADAPSRDAKSGETKSAETKPAEAKADAAAKAPQAPQTGTAAAVAIVMPEPDGTAPVATVQEVAPEIAPSQSGASALLAAAIAAQADAPGTKDAGESGEKDAAKTEGETQPGVVDPAAVPMIAALPADGNTPSAVTLSADASAAAAALAGAAAPGAGVMSAAAEAPVQPAAAIAAAVATASVEAGNAIATAVGKPGAQKDSATAPLLAGEPDTSEGDDAGMTASATGAGHPVASHLAKGETVGPASPLASQDVAAPESRISEVLQPLQGMIDLSASAQGRSAKLDTAFTLLTPEQASAQTANAQAQTASGGPPTPLHVVPIEIGLRALAGGRKFDIRLDPAELGRVDVSLSISDNGEVTAKLVVDRVETLHMLQRDARTLERAFEQAGLKPSNAGVDITLRDPSDQSGFRQNRQHDEAPRRTPTLADLGEDIAVAARAEPSTTIRGLVRVGGVDLSI